MMGWNPDHDDEGEYYRDEDEEELEFDERDRADEILAALKDEGMAPWQR